jgi:dolichol-phosphate mannosyltransferase
MFHQTAQKVFSPPSRMDSTAIDLSIVIPALNEAENLSYLIPRLKNLLDELQIEYEILIIDHAPNADTLALVQQQQMTLYDQQQPGYGTAIRVGLNCAQGEYVLTMDADLSHSPAYVKVLWDKRHEADILIASRYTRGGRYKMPLMRTILSRTLNIFFSRGLSLYTQDMSSGYRLYNTKAIQSLHLQNQDFALLQEILVKAYCEGWRVLEIPFEYVPRLHGSSHARVFALGKSYLRTFWKMYRLRNSILSADYDDRAYDSVVIPQRYWQRERFRHIVQLIDQEGAVLDVGCGSSRIIGALPRGSVALDILFRKLRYSRKFAVPLLHSSGFALPFGDASFDCVVCSQVIEHVPKDSPILSELIRVLAPGGALILGTPDYANWEWRFIEAIYARVLPSAYADEHISHYTKDELVQLFQSQGYTLEDTRYILRGELILKLRKPGGTPEA